MKAKWVPCLLARALEHREKRFHDMPSKGIRKGVVIKGVENVTRDNRAVEWHRHRGGTGTKKLSVDGGVV
jgi:hypothetical protein